jgi:hypothetical protein
MVYGIEYANNRFSPVDELLHVNGFEAKGETLTDSGVKKIFTF